MDDFCAVGAHEIDAVAERCHPFAVGTIDTDVVDGHALKEIVGIVGPVVARHLHLGDAEIRVGPFVGVGDDVDASCGTNPEGAVAVFRNGVDALREVATRAVLIIGRRTEGHHVVFRVVNRSFIIKAGQAGHERGHRAA